MNNIYVICVWSLQVLFACLYIIYVFIYEYIKEGIKKCELVKSFWMKILFCKWKGPVAESSCTV